MSAEWAGKAVIVSARSKGFIMKRVIVNLLGLIFGLSLLSMACIGFNPTLIAEENESEVSEVDDKPATPEEDAGQTVTSQNPVTTPDGDQVGESELERTTDKIVLKFEACCITPGNAYTAWWVIGDVVKPMSAVKTLLATGFIADKEGVKLELDLNAGLGGINNHLDGVRLAVLDHGEATGDPLQLSTPGGGCTSMPCPVALETSHAAP
jgi:hypothetical protein